MAQTQTSRVHSGVLLIFFFAALFVLHFPLLHLPYFWDEAGYYVPAARDLLLTGSLIPHTTLSNAHPPLALAYLALCWKIFGYSIPVTRTAMLMIAAFALVGIFRLAERVANLEVAIASTLCTALYPVFFAQSSMAHIDMAAAALTFWGLLAYVEKRPAATAVWLSLAALAKETAILAPFAVFIVLALSFAARRFWTTSPAGTRKQLHLGLALTVPAFVLSLWYLYHRLRTGIVFGNPEFFRYNVEATLHPFRILLAFLLRLWQTFGFMNLYVLTVAALLAMFLAPQADKNGEQRPRIVLSVQFAFLAVVAAYVAFMAVIGGAELVRYLLPAVPLVIIVFVSTLWRRVRAWRVAIALVAVCLVVGLFVNPPYGFAPEDNLAYRDFVQLHQRAETFLEARYPMARVLTAWPATGELSQPWLGYVSRPMRTLQVEDFTEEQLASALKSRSEFDVALVFSTKYEPPHPMLESWPVWERIKMQYFGYHHDLLPAAAAQKLGGRVVYSEFRRGLWIGVIELK